VSSTIAERFDQQVADRPSHLAIAGTLRLLTYSELDAVASCYEAAMLDRRIGGQVALLLGHDAPLVAATLAALRLGMTVVTLNPSDPPARLAQIRAAAETSLLVTDTLHAELGRAAGFADSQTLVIPPESGEATATASDYAGPDSLAFLICTSGSTGQPKIVMQTHRNMLHNVLRYTNGLAIRQDDRIAWLASLSGGQGLVTVWSTLLNGATLCPFPIVERGVTGLASWLTEHGITVFDTLPSVLRNFSRVLGEERLPGIRLVRLASEPALRGDFDAYRRHFEPDCTLASVLGSSEAGIIAQGILHVDDQLGDGRLSVGTPATGIEVLLLDDTGRPAESGQIGEVVIQGDYLSPGYWRDEALTAERFDSVNGVRRFRTGDLARRADSGILTVVGRADGQVKVRGHRLQLEEVEAALARHADVGAAAVAVNLTERGDARLTAYLIPAPGHSLDHRQLRESLTAALPRHAIPSEFIGVEAFPLTPHGKVDRAQLAMLTPVPPAAGKLERPLSEMEELLLGLWSTAFEHDDIGVEDGFLQAGGDSLTAAVIAAGVHQLFGVELSLREFASDPAVATLAPLIDRLRCTRAHDEEPPLRAFGRQRQAPLSYHQEQLWSVASKRAAGHTLALPFRIHGSLDVEALRHSLGELVHRHEILRTTFPERDGQPIQVVQPATVLELPLEDLRGEPNPSAIAEAVVAREANTVFDLAARPPLSLRLLRLGEDEHQLLVVIHHLICDAPSWKFFFDELAVTYEARLSGGPSPLPDEPPLQYADYAVWERACMRPGSPRHEREVAWWQEAFSSPPPALELPFERAVPLDSSPLPAGVCDWELAPEQAAAFVRIGREAGATRFMTWAAAFAALIALETGVDDIVLNTYTTTRRRAELQRMLGLFINRSLLRMHFSADQTFHGWLADVRGAVLDMSANCTIPYEELWRELQSRGVPKPAPRPTLLALYPVPPMSFGGIELEPLRRQIVAPWMFSLGHESHRGRAVFDTRLYEPDGVERFLSRLQELVGMVCAEPDRPLRDLHAAFNQRVISQESRMPSIEDVASVVDALPHAPGERGPVLAKMIDDHAARDVLVLGHARGGATCYIAAALERRGAGHVVTIGRAHSIADSPSVEELLATLGVGERATIFYEYDGYNWRLHHFLAQRPRPQFDLVFINGRHSWEADGLAFLLAEQLLAPGGYIIFAALRWTIATSPTLASQTTHIPSDRREAQQVKVICEQLVKPHPNIAEYWEDSLWGFARKRDDRGSRVDAATRNAALELMREQARELRQRAESAWKAEQWEALVAPNRLTGVRPKPVRAFIETAETTK
jgi:amino acid adenylation domain-containing protein